MIESEYEQFTGEILRTLEADPNVLGFVAMGSMADASYRDAWSDHDFWIITRPGYQDVLLNDRAWLPDADRILVGVRHGRRHGGVLYRSGHQAEFAVFDTTEATTGTITVYRVLFDRGDVTSSVEQARMRVGAIPWDEEKRTFVFDNFLMVLHTAVARWHRGERSSARRYLGEFAVNALLGLVVDCSPSATSHARDPADPRRRIERMQPHVAAAVEEIVCLPVPEAAIALLALADEVVAPRWAAYPAQRAAGVRAMLVEAETG